jgi:hypothetical protein
MNFGADLNSIHAGNISLSRHKRHAAIVNTATSKAGL